MLIIEIGCDESSNIKNLKIFIKSGVIKIRQICAENKKLMKIARGIGMAALLLAQKIKCPLVYNMDNTLHDEVIDIDGHISKDMPPSTIESNGLDTSRYMEKDRWFKLTKDISWRDQESKNTKDIIITETESQEEIKNCIYTCFYTEEVVEEKVVKVYFQRKDSMQRPEKSILIAPPTLQQRDIFVRRVREAEFYKKDKTPCILKNIYILIRATNRLICMEYINKRSTEGFTIQMANRNLLYDIISMDYDQLSLDRNKINDLFGYAMIDRIESYNFHDAYNYLKDIFTKNEEKINRILEENCIYEKKYRKTAAALKKDFIDDIECIQNQIMDIEAKYERHFMEAYASCAEATEEQDETTAPKRARYSESETEKSEISQIIEETNHITGMFINILTSGMLEVDSKLTGQDSSKSSERMNDKERKEEKKEKFEWILSKTLPCNRKTVSFLLKRLEKYDNFSGSKKTLMKSIEKDHNKIIAEIRKEEKQVILNNLINMRAFGELFMNVYSKIIFLADKQNEELREKYAEENKPIEIINQENIQIITLIFDYIESMVDIEKSPEEVQRIKEKKREVILLINTIQEDFLNCKTMTDLNKAITDKKERIYAIIAWEKIDTIYTQDAIAVENIAYRMTDAVISFLISNHSEWVDYKKSPNLIKEVYKEEEYLRLIEKDRLSKDLLDYMENFFYAQSIYYEVTMYPFPQNVIKEVIMSIPGTEYIITEENLEVFVRITYYFISVENYIFSLNSYDEIWLNPVSLVFFSKEPRITGNIGYITYRSDKDEGTHTRVIKLTEETLRLFENAKTPSDIESIPIHDDSTNPDPDSLTK